MHHESQMRMTDSQTYIIFVMDLKMPVVLPGTSYPNLQKPSDIDDNKRSKPTLIISVVDEHVLVCTDVQMYRETVTSTTAHCGIIVPALLAHQSTTGP